MAFDFGAFASPYGYTDDAAGIAQAQADWGVPVTGLLDDGTIAVLTRIPRCGTTDAQPVGNVLDKWGLPVVSWFIEGYPVGLGLSKSDVETAVTQAFESWRLVCGLGFTKASSADSCNIRMGVGQGRRANFDGPSGTLAWCEIPQGGNFRGQIRLMWDLAEAWTLDPRVNGILLLNTTAHEIGHGLGLYHNTKPNQLMNPVYNRSIATPQSYEISEVVARYGPAKPVTSPTPPVVPGNPAVGKEPVAVKIQSADGTVWGGMVTRL